MRGTIALPGIYQGLSMREKSLSRFFAAGIGIVIACSLLTGAGAQNTSQPAMGAPSGRPASIRLNLPDENAKPPKVSSSGVALPATGTSPNSSYFYETPSSLGCVYGLVAQSAGCNPNSVNTVVPNASSPLSIAIVIAYHNPGIQSDLAAFDTQFGLKAPPSFTVVYASNAMPSQASSNWAVEGSLDVEWAHAMSPNAKIYFVEAASNSLSDFLKAVSVASSKVAADGGGIVSMSLLFTEFSTEATYETNFQTSGVTYIAASGDAPGVGWPSTSAYVIAAGGTTISRNPATGNFISEGTWQQTGGGSSAYISRPPYQNGIASIVGGKRGVPDIAAVADPQTGAWVYSKYGLSGWGVVGGTSLAAPVLAGFISHTGIKYPGIQGALTSIYAGTFATFRDIVSGNCGPYAGFIAGQNWDFCTGRGSLLGGNTTTVIANASHP